MDVTVLKIYAPNTRAPKFIKETLPWLKSHFGLHTVIVDDFSTPLPLTESSSRQKLSRTTGIQQHQRSNGHNRHLQNIPPKH